MRSQGFSINYLLGSGVGPGPLLAWSCLWPFTTVCNPSRPFPTVRDEDPMAAYGKVMESLKLSLLDGFTREMSFRVADVVVTRDVDVTKKCQKLLGVAGAILFHKEGSVFCGRRSTWERNRVANAAKRVDVTLRGRRNTSDRYICVSVLRFSHWNICPVASHCCCMC